MRGRAIAATLLWAIFMMSMPLTVGADINALIVQTSKGTVTVLDVDVDHWAARPIADAILQERSNGKEVDENGNMKFAPNDLVSRYELIALIARMAGVTPIDGASKQSFSDISASNPYYGYIEAMAENFPFNSMLMSGELSGQFNGHSAATREDIMVICANALNFGDNTAAEAEEILKDFADKADISPGNKPKVSLMIREGIIKGSDGFISPKQYLTRAEAITIIDRATRVPNILRAKHLIYPRPIQEPTFTIKGEVDVETRVFIRYHDSSGYEQEAEATVDNKGVFTSQAIKTNVKEPKMVITICMEKLSRRQEQRILLDVSPKLVVSTE